MKKLKIRMPDGRNLIYYNFEKEQKKDGEKK